MEPLVSPREQTLGPILLVLGLIGWALLILGTVGIALVYMLMVFVFYVFAQSAFIAYLRGTAVRLSEQQLAPLHASFVQCCAKLGIDKAPEAYVLQGGGMLNAFATRFLGRDFVVLLSDVVDALDEHPDGVAFYIGHELGHVRRKHLTGNLLRWPVLWLPLVGASYSRAKETTCDLHGRACCTSGESAARSMMVLAAGQRLWASANVGAYVEQARGHRGFWASFHELTSAYPWLNKRVARLAHGAEAAALPPRHALAWLPALLVPFAGRLGGGAGFFIVVAMIGILAAVALPAYHDYTQRAQVAEAWVAMAPVRQGLARWYDEKKAGPDSLAQAGVAAAYRGRNLELNRGNMTVTVPTAAGALVMEPRLDERKRLMWRCTAGEGLREQALPLACRQGR